VSVSSRRGSRLGGLGAIAVLALSLGASRASAYDGRFSGVAAAAGVRVTLLLPNAPATNEPADLGAPVAQAALDSLGSSQGFASFPYPGDLVVSAPGLVAGFAPGTPSLPPYPLYVSSDHPLRPAASLSLGPLQLHATSTPSSSASSARVSTANADQPGGSLSATASLQNRGDGTVIATSVGDTAGFSTGPLRIGSIRSTATVTLKSDGSVSRQSSLEIADVTVGGTKIGLGPQGVTLADRTVPLPSSSPVRSALEAAGIQVSYLSSENTKSGIVAAGIKISQVFSAPTAGTGRIVYLFGQSSAEVSGNTDGQSLRVTDSPMTLGQVPTATGPTGGAVSAPGDAPGVIGAAKQKVAPSSTPTAALGRAPRGATSVTARLGAASLYLVLVMAAVTALGAGSLVRWRAVRLPWS
jgi:hypothetical protein